MVASNSNIFFVPLRPPYRLCQEADQVIVQEARKIGYNPTYIHQFFHDERILSWSEDTVICLFYCVYSNHFYLKIIGTPNDKSVLDATNDVIKAFVSVDSELYGDVITRDFAIFLTRCQNSESYIGTTLQVFQRTDSVLEVMKFHFAPAASALVETPDLTADDSLVTNGMNYYGFTGIHRRLEWFMHSFIETCSSIDTDERWSIYFLVKTEKSEITKEDVVRFNDVLLANHQPLLDVTAKEPEATFGRLAKKEVVSLVSVYDHIGFPKSRRRVAQFFTPPIQQGKGYGSILLDHCYDELSTDEGLLEMAVEDPGPAYVQLRDRVGMKKAVPILRKFMKSPLYPNNEDYYNKYISALKGMKCIDENDTTLKHGKRAVTEDYLSLSVNEVEEREAVVKAAMMSLKGLMTDVKQARNVFRTLVKESDNQADRLIEILILSKYLPEEFNPLSVAPSVKRQKLDEDTETMFTSRGYRVSNVSLAVVETIAQSLQLLPLRLWYFMRYLDKADLGASKECLTLVEALKLHLNDTTEPPLIDTKVLDIVNADWLSALFCHMRTVTKLRSENSVEV